MFCPFCSTEYRPGFTDCADCGVALVDAAPLERGIGSAGDLGDLVPVRQVWEPALLPVLTSKLESAEIPVVVQGEHSLHTVGLAQLFRGADPANVFWTLLVPATRAAEAVRLLDQEGGVEDPAVAEDPDSDEST